MKAHSSKKKVESLLTRPWCRPVRLKRSNIDEDDQISSYTLKLTYDEDQQLTDLEMETYNYSTFYETGMTYTTKITSSESVITYPDLSNYHEAT